MTKRVFVAINLPPETKRELENLAKNIEEELPEEGKGAIRWLKESNLHLTLLFIGGLREDYVPKVGEIVRKAAQARRPFSLKVEKISYGPPGITTPRLIWVEIEKKPELLEIANQLKIEGAGAKILRKIEKRGFSPHITLGRIRTFQWRRMPIEEWPQLDRELVLEFGVNSIEVMESLLKRTGAEYRILESVKLT